MNIIYLLTNIDKSEGKRYYIGSKQECCIEDIDGIPTIVSLKTARPYYGSSTCQEMKSDMISGHRFSAELLESVPDKKNLIERERYHMELRNVVESEEYYNKTLAHVGIFNVDQHAPYNKYGETILQYGKRQSSYNKRNNNAKRFGFKNLGEFCVWIHMQRLLGYNGAQVSAKIGWERHQAFRYVNDYNMNKCFLEYDPRNQELIKEVRKLVSTNVSFEKVAELYGLEIPTVSMLVGDYEENKTYIVATRRGVTKEELEIEITRLVLSGIGFNEVSKQMNIDETSIKRYFMRCVKRNLNPNKLI